MEMTQTAKRLDHIDIAKAIGLLLVIYGHTFRMSMRAAHPWCAFSYTFVYRFHVPLLFLLSGMGCTLTAQKNRSLSARQYVCKKARSLLLPWGIYSGFLYALFCMANLVPPVRALLSGSAYQLKQPAEYLWLVLRNENPYGFHLWYLPTLFWLVLTAWLLDKALSPAAARTAKLVLVVALPACYQLLFTEWFWAVKSYFQQGAFFFLGCVLPRETAEQHAKPLALFGALCGLWVVWDCCRPLWSGRMVCLQKLCAHGWTILRSAGSVWASGRRVCCCKSPCGGWFRWERILCCSICITSPFAAPCLGLCCMKN